MSRLVSDLAAVAHGAFYAPTQLRALRQEWHPQERPQGIWPRLNDYISGQSGYFARRMALLVTLASLPLLAYCLASHTSLTLWLWMLLSAWIVGLAIPSLGIMLPTIALILGGWPDITNPQEYVQQINTAANRVLIGDLGLLILTIATTICIRHYLHRNKLQIHAINLSSTVTIINVLLFIALLCLLCKVELLSSIIFEYKPLEQNSFTLSALLTFVIRAFFVVAGLVALIYMLLGAFAWIISGGDRDAIGAARDRIQAAVIGMIMIVVMMALIWTLETLVFQRKISIGLSAPLNIPGLINAADSPVPTSTSMSRLIYLQLLIPLLLAAYGSLNRSNSLYLLILALAFGTFVWISHSFLLALFTVGLISLVGLRITVDYATYLAIRLLYFFKRKLPLIRLLPPISSELLWLPLPGYARILAAHLREQPADGIELVRYARTLPSPGIRRMLRGAVPLVTADQLAHVDSLRGITLTSSAEHPVLSVLVPEIYSDTADGTVAKKGSTVYLGARFVKIAQELKQAAELQQSFLRQASLHEVRSNLDLLGKEIQASTVVASPSNWLQVVERWSGIVSAEIEYIEKLTGGESIQPFQYGVPLTAERSKLFKGREEFAAAVARHVMHHGTSALVLYGPRRCGKTSFLLNVSRLLPKSITPIYVDMTSGGLMLSTYDWCFGIAYKVANTLQLNNRFKPTSTNFKRENPYHSLQEWLESIKEPLGGQRLLLCFDEIERLGTAISAGELSEDVLGQLRYLIQHTQGMTFLFCGARTLSELGPQWTNYFINARPLEMTYLQPDEARALLTNPDPAFKLTYDEPIIAQVLHDSHCQPYLVQLLGHELVNQANSRGTQHITNELYAAAVDSALTAGEIYFSELWENTVGRSDEERAHVQSLLWNIAHQQPIEHHTEPFTAMLLRQLQRHHLITRHTTEYAIEVPLVQRWIQERAG